MGGSMTNAQVVSAIKEHSVEVQDDPNDRDSAVRVYLSRRNLETLINKLDANRKREGESQCTLIKKDTEHPQYPQSHSHVFVTAVEDEEYYIDRAPGLVVVH